MNQQGRRSVMWQPLQKVFNHNTLSTTSSENEMSIEELLAKYGCGSSELDDLKQGEGNEEDI